MNKAIKVRLLESTLQRFEQVMAPGGDKSTIVKVKKTSYGAQYTIKKVKWSRYKLINKIIKLWLTIKYI